MNLAAYSTSALDEEEISYPFEDIDLNDVLQHVTNNLLSLLHESAASITTDFLPNLQGNPEQITWLFESLIQSSIQNRKAEEPLRVHVAAESLGDEWLLTVSDNGKGYRTRDADRVFEHVPGQQIEFAICRDVIERHKGRIWAHSQPGKGAQFHILLPTCQQN